MNSGDKYRAMSLAYQFGPPLVAKKTKVDKRKRRRLKKANAYLPRTHKASTWLQRFALENIDKATRTERLLLNVLCEVLPRHKLTLRFQYPAARYIVDFYIPEVQLGIEVDGEYHEFTVTKDRLRSRILRKVGIRIVRFKNWEVEENVTDVVNRVLAACGPAYEQAV